MIPFFSFLRGVWARAVDFLLPPLCLVCDGPVTQDKTLCAACWKTLHFISTPLCACCGAPFDLPVEDGTLCGACLAHPPAYARARSALLYDDASKPILLRLKHADRLHPVPALAEWMARAGRDLLAQGEVIVPVPLHRWRLLKRRYNQSALLAQALGKAAGVPVAVDALIRVRATPSQGQRNRKARQENVRGAFAVSGAERVRGRRVLLVDDVLTSGATVEECARVLLAAGAAQVDVLTLARVRMAS